MTTINTYYDFDKLYRECLFLRPFRDPSSSEEDNKWLFEWEELPDLWKIKGEISKFQMSAPGVDVNIGLFNANGEQVYAYVQHTYYERFAHIEWLDQLTNKKYAATFQDEQLEGEIQEIQDFSEVKIPETGGINFISQW